MEGPQEAVVAPLFPCYVFLHGSLRRRVEVLRTPGVHKFVGFGGVPCSIPAEEIQGVRRAIQSSLAIEPHPYLSCGDRVRVKAGPLAGSEGVLVWMKNRYRLVLSIELLNRSVSVETDLTQVERLTSNTSLTVF
jgi:transcription antitermination factor NusG